MLSLYLANKNKNNTLCRSISFSLIKFLKSEKNQRILKKVINNVSKWWQVTDDIIHQMPSSKRLNFKTCTKSSYDY